MQWCKMPDDIAHPAKPGVLGQAASFMDDTLRTFGFPLFWPYASLEAATELILNARNPIYRGHGARYGDGKPLLLVPGHLGGDVTLEPLSMWLRAIGYRPAMSTVRININDQLLDKLLTKALRSAAHRIGRKAVMVAFDTGARAALRVAAAEPGLVSDLIVLGCPERMPPTPGGLRLHSIDVAGSLPAAPEQNVHRVQGSRALLSVNPAALQILSATLRAIPIELLDRDGPGEVP